MLDIEFYQKIEKTKRRIDTTCLDKHYVLNILESSRSKYPIIYNIETTNLCNMKCQMCPRTTLMNRKIEEMDMNIYKKIINQIKPFSYDQWNRWEDFVKNNYGISKNDMSENHFFLYIIPKVIVLHGFGEPVLDKLICKRIELLANKNIPTYFSCNPSNLKLDKIDSVFKSGLNFLKFSLESTDDTEQKRIRGNASNFTESCEKIFRILDKKHSKGYSTTLVISIIDINPKKDEFEKFQETFKNTDIYIYKKAQDCKWYKDNTNKLTSIHWLEFCQFPWSSMTVYSNGDVVPCTQDCNADIKLGNVKETDLIDIWNGNCYKKFRNTHCEKSSSLRCHNVCDMKVVGKFIK
ncbi:MAG: SPASM domain-containing protein [Candidatus Woesearchaeota archaeon]|jgi:radical SAM protein with 4Fe4S-binding SPASM domain